MHSTKIIAPGWYDVIIHHNGDWSGDYILVGWLKPPPKPTPFLLPVGPPEPDIELNIKKSGFKVVKVPDNFDKIKLMNLALAVGKTIATDRLSTEVISFIEQRS